MWGKKGGERETEVGELGKERERSRILRSRKRERDKEREKESVLEKEEERERVGERGKERGKKGDREGEGIPNLITFHPI